jgi:hypothetical protein
LLFAACPCRMDHVRPCDRQWRLSSAPYIVFLCAFHEGIWASTTFQPLARYNIPEYFTVIINAVVITSNVVLLLPLSFSVYHGLSICLSLNCLANKVNGCVPRRVGSKCQVFWVPVGLSHRCGPRCLRCVAAECIRAGKFLKSCHGLCWLPIWSDFKPKPTVCSGADSRVEWSFSHFFLLPRSNPWINNSFPEEPLPMKTNTHTHTHTRTRTRTRAHTHTHTHTHTRLLAPWICPLLPIAGQKLLLYFEVYL